MATTDRGIRRNTAVALDLARKTKARLDDIDLRKTRGAVRDELREARAETDSAVARLEAVLEDSL